MDKNCEKDNPNTTKCIACPDGQYQAIPNKDSFCRQCKNKQNKANRILRSNCTKTHDLEYGDCEIGYYYNSVYDSCEKCRACPPGFGVEKDCNTRRNTKCSVKKCSLVSSLVVTLQ